MTADLVRLLLAAICFAAGFAALLPMVADRYRPLAAVLVLVVGSTAVVIGIALPYVRKGGGDRG
jgi:hypothetical protein